MTLRERIIEHLKTKGTYDPNVDDDQVDELIENSMFAKRIFKELLKEGAILHLVDRSGNPYTKMNPAMNAYQMMMRNVFQMSSKLGISRSDRLKLKIVEMKREDEFSKLMNE